MSCQTDGDETRLARACETSLAVMSSEPSWTPSPKSRDLDLEFFAWFNTFRNGDFNLTPVNLKDE